MCHVFIIILTYLLMSHLKILKIWNLLCFEVKRFSFFSQLILRSTPFFHPFCDYCSLQSVSVCLLNTSAVFLHGHMESLPSGPLR